MAATILPLIARKRDGLALETAEIEWLVQTITEREVPDYQLGALLMAIYLRGMSDRETMDLTMAMVHSGRTIDLRPIAGFKIDKHSTGGVGDKVTLVLGPLVAAAGLKFAKLSGRGLGHTGGTLDKLEAIPGMRVDLSRDELIQQVQEIGLAVSGQSAELVPADGILYAMRDLTATVDSIPLIASSIMCKKIAAGADGILLDVKCGRGAFMRSHAEAMQLGEVLVSLGRSAGKNTAAFITSMDQPLGRAIGNAVEVAEAIATLGGNGPDDLVDQTLTLAAYGVCMAGIERDLDRAEGLLREKIDNGEALDKLRAMISRQGGDARVVADPSILPQPARIISLPSRRRGYVLDIDALAIGQAAMQLGAGRRIKSDAVDPAAGIVLVAGTGDHIEPGDVLTELHAPAESRLPDYALREVEEKVRRAYALGSTPRPSREPLVEIVGQLNS